jgi:hypothetical protein
VRGLLAAPLGEVAHFRDDKGDGAASGDKQATGCLGCKPLHVFNWFIVFHKF